MSFNRRTLLRALAYTGAVAVLPSWARADEGLFPFKDDRGRPVYNYRLPAELNVDGVPGVLWAGTTTPTAMLVEFFDYNCPHCRAASKDINALVQADSNVRLGLVNNPIFGLGSVQAAKVQQAVLRAEGPAKAYLLHERLLARHGPTDGQSALQAAAEMGLDRNAIETSAELPQINATIKKQAQLADSFGFNATPSFIIDGIGIHGYPGPKALARAVASTRRCDKLVC